jgi:hypothetical protein
VLFQTMNDIIGNAVAFFRWFFLFGPKKRRVPNNPALYDCRRCIGNWLAARQNASTARACGTTQRMHRGQCGEAAGAITT